MVDIVSALRSLRASPAIPIVAIFTTSLAVAMNLAMAGLIDRALLSPPAHVLGPERVFTVGFEVEAPSGERVAHLRSVRVEGPPFAARKVR